MSYWIPFLMLCMLGIGLPLAWWLTYHGKP
jgi:hypothetical protein